MSDDLLRIAYISRNAMPYEDEDRIRFEIDAILEASQPRNAAVGVGGALMFNHGVFVQVLEGPTQAVEATFNRIQCDPRHRDVAVLEIEPIAATVFHGWSMGFVGRDVAEAEAYAGIAARSGFDAAAEALPDLYRTLHGLAVKKDLRRRAA
ncbi:MAG: BLUF domain-containing protein [Pseudomonadota bacterium]